MIYTVLIAVCMVSTPAADCQKPTAVDWIVAPETPASVSGCMLHGMEYAAASRLVGHGAYAKIFCTPQMQAEAQR